MPSDRVNINAPIIKEDGAFQNDLRTATSTDDIVRAAQSLRERAQGLVYDPSSGQYRAAAPAASTAEQSREVTKTVEIGGREFSFTASSEAEMAALISNAQLVAESVAAPVRDENGRFTRSGEPADDGGAEAARQAELNLKMMRGEIDIKTFLAESGAVGSWLQDQGVSIEDLRAAAGQRTVQDWQQAVETFLAGSDWPGGAKNLHLIRTQLTAMGAEDAEDKVAALQAAYSELRNNGTLFPYEGEATQADILKATSTMSPEEMLALWKEQYAGGNADAANRALIESFRRKG